MAAFRRLTTKPGREETLQIRMEQVEFHYQNGSTVLHPFDFRASPGDMIAITGASVVASDAHSCRYRTPWMEDMRQMLSREFSPTAARYLLQRNPRLILTNQPLSPAEPEWF